MNTNPKITDVAAWMDERDRVNSHLVRRLAEQGRMDIADAIYEDAPQMLYGSSPRLKAVTR